MIKLRHTLTNVTMVLERVTNPGGLRIYGWWSKDELQVCKITSAAIDIGRAILNMSEPTKGKTTFTVQELMAQRPANIHKGSQGTSDSCDISDMIDKSGCSKEYYLLEECLGEHDRRWAKCQTEVNNLKACNANLPKR